MTDDFTFNARQYFDFNQDQDDLDGESFFELSEEQNLISGEEDSIPNGNQHKTSTQSAQIMEALECSDTESEAVFFSPMDPLNISTSSTLYLSTKLRRSLSMHNLPVDEPDKAINSEMENLNLSHHEEIQRPASACSIDSKSKKASSKDHINRLAQPKRFASQDNLTKARTMTLAEAVNNFQAGTPRRFRSKPSPKMNKMAPMRTTAHTPNLRTTARARPNNAISQEEQLRLEVEEAKKFKIKANPVNKRALRGPLKPQIEHKPPTQFNAFNITEVKKKPEQQPKKNIVPVFKAQPLPKSLRNPFKVHAAGQPPTRGISPSFAQKYTKPPSPKVQAKAETITKKTGPTLIQPFSFERRDQMMMKKKEEFINQVLEEEKKAREFHAKPPPKSILRSRNNSSDRISECDSTKSSKSNSHYQEPVIFKAKPATVLLKKPFVPKLEDHVIEVNAFNFSTDQRVEARHEFEEHIKELEQLQEQQRKEQEELRKKQEEAEIARIRKEAEHKAQPIKKYKEIAIKPSNKITKPVSPKFHIRHSKNKENVKN